MPTLEAARPWYPAADPVHGFDHVQRVCRLAEHLARAEGADLEIVRAAALLHDAQDPSSSLEQSTAVQRQDHHHASADFARQVLLSEGWPEERVAAVEHCIRAHRFRDERQPPQTLEAQVLFDADKLDAIGAIGVARAIAYALNHGSLFYAPVSQRFLENGRLESGELHSAYHEFIFKLRRIKERLYTPTARAIAAGRHQAMEAYFNHLAQEMNGEGENENPLAHSPKRE